MPITENKTSSNVKKIKKEPQKKRKRKKEKKSIQITHFPPSLSFFSVSFSFAQKRCTSKPIYSTTLHLKKNSHFISKIETNIKTQIIAK